LRPASDVSVVAPMLLLRGVPVHMPHVTIKIECNGGHGVAEIIRSERGPPGDVFVAFEELRWASLLCSAIYLRQEYPYDAIGPALTSCFHSLSTSLVLLFDGT
jgi:hypothetical protein